MYYAQAVEKNAIDTASIVPHFEALAARYPNSGIRNIRHGTTVEYGEEFSRILIKIGLTPAMPHSVRTVDDARKLYADLRTCLRRGLTGRELDLTMCRIGGRRP